MRALYRHAIGPFTHRRAGRHLPLRTPHFALLAALLFAVAAGQAGAAEPNGVLLHLPFDGAAAARTAAGEFAPRVGGAPAYVEGVVGQAIVVGGKDRLAYPAAGAFDPRQGACTFWAAPQDWTAGVETFQFLVSFLNTRGNVDFLLYKVHNAPLLTFLARDAAGSARVLDKGILSWRRGEWHHVAATWDAKQYRFYLDGKRVAEQPALAVPAEGWQQIVVGTAYPGWAKLGEEKTAIDEVRVYDRPLAPEEIDRQVSAAREASPVLRRRLAERAAMEARRKRENLALAANGAIVLTSSFADYHAGYSDNAIDGDPDTGWRSFDNEMPQWLEVRWEYPVTANALAFTEVRPSRTTAFSVQAWEGKGTWRVVQRVTAVQADEDGRMACEFPPVSTSRLRLVVEGQAAPNTHYTEVEVMGPAQVNVGALRPFWKGYHIWYPEPDQLVRQEPRCFRTTFEVGAQEKVQSAFVQLYTNDLYTVFLNGKEVAKGFKRLDPVSVGQHVRPGKNSLAVLATPTSQPGWPNMALTADLTINTDARTQYVTTDRTWRVSRESPAGWEQPDFDDGKWEAPFLVGRVGDAVWGRLAYTDRAAREPMRVEQVEMPARPLRPGDTATLRLHLRPLRPLKDDFVLVWEAGDRSVLPGSGDYTVCRGSVLPPVPTSQWPADKETVVEIPIPLPAFAPDGEIPVRVEGLNTGAGRGLKLVDAAGQAMATVGTLDVDRFTTPGARLVAGSVMLPGSLEARVTREAPVLAFEWNGEARPPIMWAYECPTFEKIHLSAGTGVHLYQARGYPLQPDGTPERVERLCRLLDQHITSILRVDRDAYVLVMLDLRPSPAWRAQHPEAALVTASGKTGPHSYFTKEHRALVLDALRAVIRHVRAQPYAGRVFSYQLCTCGDPDSVLGGIDDNLFQKERAKLTLGDYNPQAIAAFRAWLREKYQGDLKKLRAAWRDAGVTFETARPDNAVLCREGAGGGIFRDPAAGGMPADYFQFLSGGILRFLFQLAACTREETGGRALTGNYYGYDVAALRGYNVVGSTLQNNNFELDSAMKSDLFDYYAMVPSYNHRLAGSHFEPQHATASMRLHKRMYVAELDTRSVTAEARQWGRQRSVRESVEMMKRDLGEKILHGHAAWFADWDGHGLRGAGYFTDPDLLGAIARCQEIYRETLKTPRPDAAQIAVFVSGKAWFHHEPYTAPPLYNNLVRHFLFEQIGHIGAPYDVYRLEDLPAVSARRQYRLLILLNAFALDAQDRKAIEGAKRDGRTILSFYAPGYVDPARGLDAAGIGAVTGIGVAVKPGKEVMECRVAPGEHPIVAGLAPGNVQRVLPYYEAISDELHPTAFAPMFAVADPGATVLGAYPDGKPALAVRDFGAWRSVYSAVPAMDAALLRNIARYAGVHLYCAPGPVVMAHGPFLMIHKGYEGDAKLTVDLPAARTVTDLYTGKVLAEKTQRLELDAPGCRTYLLELR